MNKQDIRALEAIYSRIPSIECKGLCQASCGPIGLTRLERKRIRAKINIAPSFDENLQCKLLKDGRCRAYSVRPTICRLWGVVEIMKCPHGCVPDRYLTRAEGIELIKEVEAISPSTPYSLMLVQGLANLLAGAE